MNLSALAHEQAPDEVLPLPPAAQARDLEVEHPVVLQHAADGPEEPAADLPAESTPTGGGCQVGVSEVLVLRGVVESSACSFLVEIRSE